MPRFKTKKLSSISLCQSEELKLNKVEEEIKNIGFEVHKFNNKPKPDKSNIVIFSAFSEFGCESLIPIYCIPQLMQTKYRGKYSIVMGWYGRAYLYRHLVDEFWEIQEPYQHLREYCRAFHHVSRNLARIEKDAEEHGKVITAGELSNIACFPRLLECIVTKKGKCDGRIVQFADHQKCQKCGVSYPIEGIFANPTVSKKKAVWVPPPSEEKMEQAKNFLPSNPVGIIARNRKTYGRNLKPEFYERLIWQLEDMGYNPIWLGEKATTMPCPCERIFDYSKSEYARDFELTLAIVAQCKFTVQFWTASTRLSGLVGTPFLIVESPDQIYGIGQEGYRLYLSSKGPIKLAVAHFCNVAENNTKALKMVEKSVQDMEKEDFSTVLEMVDNESQIRDQILASKNRISWF